MQPTNSIEYDRMIYGTGQGSDVSDAVSLSGARPLHKRLFRCAALVAACVALASCSSSPTKTSKNKFDPKRYGVAGSPRMVAEGKAVPKGGGRSVVGKPYKIAGKWYKPKLDPRYDKVGSASWYGKTFHGRQTANGEIFDMNALTAAHTTMPLPSYARVTNVKNGRSVIVRVNDRGPFHGNREIDLSKRVAELLDFKSRGTAKVRVQYVGKARLDGRDSRYLMASYRGPGSRGTQFAQAPVDPLVYGAAPVPASRPYIAASGFVQVAFDPAVAFQTPPTTLAYASEPAAMRSARGFSPQTTKTSLPAIIRSGAQTLGILPVSFVQPRAAKRPKEVSSYAAERRIDAAHALLRDSVSGGLALKTLSERKRAATGKIVIGG